MYVQNNFTNDTRVQKEARSLVKNGFDVTVWALALGNKNLSEYEEIFGFKVKRWKSILLQIRIIGLLVLPFALLLRLYKEKADIYHSHDPNTLLPCYIASKLNKSYLVYDAHEFWVGQSGKTLNRKIFLKLYQLIEKYFIKKADKVIVVNYSIAQKLSELYKIDPVIIMNCQEYVKFNKNKIIYDQLNLDKKNRIAIYAGSITTGRGLEVLIDSVPYLKNVIIILMGRDRLEGKLQKIIKIKKYEDYIKIIDPVPPDEVIKYISSSDVGLMPTQTKNLSYYYGSGNKLFHYIMGGIPTVVSNHPEKKRIIEKYGVGLTCDEKDPKSIADAIMKILNDKNKYNDMCQNALKAAKEELNWSQEEKKLIELYSSFNKKK